MPRRLNRLVADPPKGLRERIRVDGSVRLWWEPSAEARAKGAKPVELDAARLTWSVREAARLNREADRPAPKRPAGITVGFAIDDYLDSRDFKALRPETQRTYREKLGVVRAKWGAGLVADFTKPVLKTWYDALYDANGPTMAISLIRVFSILFSHAEMRGWRPENSNPAFRLRMEVPKGRRRVADWTQIDLLVDAADRAGLASVGHAVMISALQGQRQTDVIDARRELFREVRILQPRRPQMGHNRGPVIEADEDGELTLWIWQLTRSKRGNESAIPLHAEVVARLAVRFADTAEGPLLVDERTGQPYTRERFQDRFAEVRQAAIDAGGTALRGLQFRDLRRTFGRMSRAGGASKADVGDVLGNSAAVNQHLADIYMAPEIESLFRAVEAVQRPQPRKRKQA